MIKQEQLPERGDRSNFLADETVEKHLNREVGRLRHCGCNSCMLESMYLVVNWFEQIDEETWQLILRTMPRPSDYHYRGKTGEEDLLPT